MNPSAVHFEPLLAAGYTLFLLALATLLEWLGRHSHRRAGRFQVAGFSYHEPLDAWQCPGGHHLHRQPELPGQNRTRYRAPAHLCNACPRKGHCTDSDEGRQLEFTTVSWIESESGKFHRGLSLVLLTLAEVILLVELVRYPSAGDVVVLGAVFVLISLVALLRRRKQRHVHGAWEHWRGAEIPYRARMPRFSAADGRDAAARVPSFPGAAQAGRR